MIVTKTPLRLPLAGGLTDLKSYAHQHGGVTVSMAIDKHVYVIIKDSVDGFFDLRYTDVHEKVLDHSEIKNDLIREALIVAGLSEHPVHLVVMTDLAGESGLGTSGAVCVGLLNAMFSLKGKQKSQQELLEAAAHIEVEVLEGASGDYVKDIVGKVRDLGAYAQLPGGKISAFVVVCCPDGQQDAVRTLMVAEGHQEIGFAIERNGTSAVSI